MAFDEKASRQRLIDALNEAQAKGKSYASVSKKLGRGQNFISQKLAEGYDFTMKDLLAICDEIGVSLIWVLYGIPAKPGDEDLIREVMKYPEAGRKAVLELLRLPAKPDPHN